jgi:hypothetical protein
MNVCVRWLILEILQHLDRFALPRSQNYAVTRPLTGWTSGRKVWEPYVSFEFGVDT